MIAEPGLNFDREAYAQSRRQLIEKSLDRFLAPRNPHLLYESMRYSALAGGKRFRGLLCLAGAEAAAGAQSLNHAHEIVMPCACAIEMVHAMSLIHDDLPCMDNDDFRRGKPTNHKVYGEAIALLAGDALLINAIEVLLAETPHNANREVLIDVARRLAAAAGPEGMVGGQVADCIATGMLGEQAGRCHASPLQSSAGDSSAGDSSAGDSSAKDSSAKQSSSRESPQEVLSPQAVLEGIHKRKTGALLTFSVWSGARLAGADETVLDAFSLYGETLGLAFQIADDLLDLTGDLQTIGKTPGKDQASGKTTWVSVFGIEGARQALSKLELQGKAALMKSGLPDRALVPLSAMLTYAIQRKS